MPTVLEEPPADDAIAGTASDGDADDEGAGPPRQRPRFKQRTISFAAATVHLLQPAGASAAVPASAAPTPAVITSVLRGGAYASADAQPAEGVAAGDAEKQCGAEPAKRRRRKRRNADQPPAGSAEVGPEANHEEDAAEAVEPKPDPKQRTICFAAARLRVASAARPSAGVAPGEEHAAANPVDLTLPSPHAEDCSGQTVAPIADQTAQCHGPEKAEPAEAEVAARPKKRRQRKRQAEPVADSGPSGEVVTDAPAPGRSAPAVDPRQRTLSFAGVPTRTAPVSGDAAEGAAVSGVTAAQSHAAMPAQSDVPAISTVATAGPPAAEDRSAAGVTESIAPKPRKRAYKKRSKGADPALAAGKPADQLSDDAVPSVPSAAVPQMDPGQQKLCFAAARPPAVTSVAAAGTADGRPAKPPSAAPHVGEGQPLGLVTAADDEKLAPLVLSGTVPAEESDAAATLPTVQEAATAQVCSLF